MLLETEKELSKETDEDSDWLEGCDEQKRLFVIGWRVFESKIKNEFNQK